MPVRPRAVESPRTRAARVLPALLVASLAVLLAVAPAAAVEGAPAAESPSPPALTGGLPASFAITGRTIAWYGPTGPTRGRAKVLIDGRAVATVDLRASTFHPKELVFSKRFATTGKHTIKIEVLATAGRPNVSIDAFVVRG